MATGQDALVVAAAARTISENEATFLTKEERDDLKKVALEKYFSDCKKEIAFWEAVRCYSGPLNKLTLPLGAQSAPIYEKIFKDSGAHYNALKTTALAEKCMRTKLDKTVIESDHKRATCVKSCPPEPPSALKRQRCHRETRQDFDL